MNKAVLIVLLMALPSFASIMYTVDLDREGDASVTLSLADEESAALALPEDATDLVVVGGSFQTENGTALIESGDTGIASFSFRSSRLSEKSGSSWTLTLQPPENSSVTIFMPPYSRITSVIPEPEQIFSEDSRMQVDMDYEKMIIVSYELEDQQIIQKGDLQMEYVLIALAIILSALLIVWEIRKTRPGAAKEQEPTLGMTQGKRQMMETFNENDLKVVNLLLGSQGKAKRNELERKSGISKSSLAVALNRLERRKIIDIDRTATTHYVKLSDYFLKL